MGKLLIGVFALCLILYLLPTGYTFVKYLRVAQGIQIVMVFSALLSLLFPGKKATNMAEYIMQYGLIFVSLFGGGGAGAMPDADLGAVLVAGDVLTHARTLHVQRLWGITHRTIVA